MQYPCILPREVKTAFEQTAMPEHEAERTRIQLYRLDLTMYNIPNHYIACICPYILISTAPVRHTYTN